MIFGSEDFVLVPTRAEVFSNGLAAGQQIVGQLFFVVSHEGTKVELQRSSMFLFVTPRAYQ